MSVPLSFPASSFPPSRREREKNNHTFIEEKWNTQDIPDVSALTPVTVSHRERSYYYPGYVTETKMGDYLKANVALPTRYQSVFYWNQEMIVCELLIIMRDLGDVSSSIYCKYDLASQKASYFNLPREEVEGGSKFVIYMWNEKSSKANVLNVDVTFVKGHSYLQVMCPRKYSHGFSSLILSAFSISYEEKIPYSKIYDSSIKTVQRVFEHCQKHRPLERLYIVNGTKPGGSLKQVDLDYAIHIMELLSYMIIKRSYRDDKKVVKARQGLVALSSTSSVQKKNLKRKRDDTERRIADLEKTVHALKKQLEEQKK